jgi:hypothetical protein
MLELFGWDVGFGTAAAVALVAGALVIGGVAHLMGSVTVRYQWLVTGVAALVGGYVGSESLGALSTWGYEFDGLFILPALLGAVVVGGVVDAIVRYATEGSYTAEMRPI